LEGSNDNYISSETLYFKKSGEINTGQLLEHCKNVILRNKLKHAVIASTTGKTGLKAAETFDGIGCHLVVVTHQVGFKKAGISEFLPEYREALKEHSNVDLYTGTHAFAGVNRAFRLELGSWQNLEIMALMLRRCFGQGTKVCMECAMMAADAGLVPIDQNVLAIAGTGKGADTAWILKPAHSSGLFNLRMNTLIAKPL